MRFMMCRECRHRQIQSSIIARVGVGIRGVCCVFWQTDDIVTFEKLVPYRLAKKLYDCLCFGIIYQIQLTKTHACCKSNMTNALRFQNNMGSMHVLGSFTEGFW